MVRLPTPSQINKQVVAHNFGRANKSYDKFACVQKLAAEKLAGLVKNEVANQLPSQPLIIDLGSGTGLIKDSLNGAINGSSTIFELDLSRAMLSQARQKSASFKSIQILGDAENPPFKKATFDLAISSFCFQWIENYEKLFSAAADILKPNGFIAFALPIHGSLFEIRSASKNSGCNFELRQLPTVPALKAQLSKFFDREVLQIQQPAKIWHENPLAALKSLKKIGANYSSSKKTISTTKLQNFSEFYLKNFSSLSDSEVSLSWEIAYFIYQK